MIVFPYKGHTFYCEGEFIVDIDFKHLEKNGYLKQSDYNKLTKDWLDLLNPVRVKPIRKYMEFVRLKYEVYEKEAKKNEHVFEDIEEKIDMSFIPLHFVTTFSTSLFPDFQAEYFAPFSFLTNNKFITVEGLRVVESSQFNSLCMATFEIENIVKERFAKSKKFADIAEDVIVNPQFLVPMKVDSEFPLTIILNVNMVVK